MLNRWKYAISFGAATTAAILFFFLFSALYVRSINFISELGSKKDAVKVGIIDGGLSLFNNFPVLWLLCIIPFGLIFLASWKICTGQLKFTQQKASMNRRNR